MSAPLPSETFAAGMFVGLMAGLDGRTPQSFTELEIQQAWRDWLQERAELEDARSPAFAPSSEESPTP